MSSVRRLLHLAFELGLLLKGLFAFGEVLTGLLLFRLDHAAIPAMARWITATELSQDPNDLVAGGLLRAAESFSVDSQTFFAVYLTSHGAIKLVTVLLLACGKLWAYPLAIAVFSGFIVYQVHRYVLTPGIGLILLSVVDVAVIVLTVIEYRRRLTQTRVGRG